MFTKQDSLAGQARLQRCRWQDPPVLLQRAPLVMTCSVRREPILRCEEVLGYAMVNQRASGGGKTRPWHGCQFLSGLVDPGAEQGGVARATVYLVPEPRGARHACGAVGTWACRARSVADSVQIQGRMVTPELSCCYCCLLQADMLQTTHRQLQQFGMSCRQQAEDMCKTLGTQPAANGLYELPARGQKVAQHVTRDLLRVQDLGLIWDKIHDQVWLPSLQLAFGAREAELRKVQV